MGSSPRYSIALLDIYRYLESLKPDDLAGTPGDQFDNIVVRAIKWKYGSSVPFVGTSYELFWTEKDAPGHFYSIPKDVASILRAFNRLDSPTKSNVESILGGDK